MSDEPQTSNLAVTSTDALIHVAIMDVAVDAAIKASFLAVPWLALPGISGLFKWAVSTAFGYLSQFLEQAAAFSLIDQQTNAEAAAYQKSVEALKAAQASGDPHALQASHDDLKATLARLIHFDGA